MERQQGAAKRQADSVPTHLSPGLGPLCWRPEHADEGFARQSTDAPRAAELSSSAPCKQRRRPREGGRAGMHKAGSTYVAGVVQMEERRQREAEEQADDARRAAELQRQAEQDKAERKAAKAAPAAAQEAAPQGAGPGGQGRSKAAVQGGFTCCGVLGTLCTMMHQAAGLPSACTCSSVHRHELICRAGLRRGRSATEAACVEVAGKRRVKVGSCGSRAALSMGICTGKRSTINQWVCTGTS